MVAIAVFLEILCSTGNSGDNVTDKHETMSEVVVIKHVIKN